ncbi:(2Fe-2S)-binding protein [Rhodovulum sp. DZ06]|uniref:(2Fe-2S)-binding protein n=1 Tax=Rhodovulum sp. DZ06 TaxID=3425126 RepID=UPI003D356F3C
MIVCSCTGTTDAQINAAIDWMRQSDPDCVITPGKIYRALGRKADCGDCMKLFVKTMRANPNHPVPAELRNLRRKAKAAAG